MRTTKISKGRLWTARVLSGLVVAFMLFDGIFKLFPPPEVLEGTVSLGFAKHHIPLMGILALLSTLLYVIPRTAVLGALLLTAYFGGVVASQIRIDAPLFTHVLFAVYLAVMAWAGLWLRDERVRELLPLRSRE
ncbi:DoxX-like family protein [Paenibacillus sp. UNCCL117]|uniref:DoxX family protein n=1 Tax=unclassified Paenibacillus TaxID=185978 RepID=UPI0008906EB9|nr:MULTISPECIES: DoxX family protein [unclassified Paenibacillus]SDD31723.1 DoxX-like family protein [Paenibacillus sp. cl123]SFW40043.1 DoxX-like family protein [Paenibacillus sp. UNCCL117]